MYKLCTVFEIYYTFQGEAVRLISEGRAPCVPQWEGGATYDQIWQKKDVAEIDWNQPALKLHNFIRGSDKIPGAWSRIDGQVCMYKLPYSGETFEGENFGKLVKVRNSRRKLSWIVWRHQ